MIQTYSDLNFPLLIAFPFQSDSCNPGTADLSIIQFIYVIVLSLSLYQSSEFIRFIISHRHTEFLPSAFSTQFRSIQDSNSPPYSPFPIFLLVFRFHS